MGRPNIVATSGVKDEAAADALQRLETYINKTVPIAQFQYVTVTFNGTANADTDIYHTLNPRDPESVLYQVVKIDRAAKIYNDTSATRKAWKNNIIYLRSDTANAVATLLLTLQVI